MEVGGGRGDLGARVQVGGFWSGALRNDLELCKSTVWALGAKCACMIF